MYWNIQGMQPQAKGQGQHVTWQQLCMSCIILSTNNFGLHFTQKTHFWPCGCLTGGRVVAGLASVSLWASPSAHLVTERGGGCNSPHHITYTDTALPGPIAHIEVTSSDGSGHHFCSREREGKRKHHVGCWLLACRLWNTGHIGWKKAFLQNLFKDIRVWVERES